MQRYLACTWWVLVYTFDWFIFGFVKGMRDVSMTYRNDLGLYYKVFYVWHEYSIVQQNTRQTQEIQENKMENKCPPNFSFHVRCNENCDAANKDP